MASVVHFDLLDWFPAYLYRNQKMYTDDEKHRQQPTYEIDQLWIPRPGTDPSTFYLLPRTVIVNVNEDDDDGDDFWTDADYSDNGSQNNRTTDGTRSDDEVQLLWSARDTAVDHVPGSTPSTVVPDDDRDYGDDNDDDDDDYVAPGQEKDDDVF